MATSIPNTSLNGSERETQVRIQLTTRDHEFELPEDTGPILVSTNLRRISLSTLVNTLLESAKPVPFEFLINGQFLRTSIDEFLTANGISAEATLTVEYVRALIPPIHVSSFEHDDWVSSVDVLSSSAAAVSWASSSIVGGQERILSGSYDGLLRVWNMSAEAVATSLGAEAGGHTSSIKSAKFLSPKTVVSAGLDRSIRLWNYSEDSAELSPSLELYGHKSGVDRISVHAPSARILSASSDMSVGLWSTKKSNAPPAPPNLIPSSSSKRRKLSHKQQPSQTAQRGPLSLMTGHTAPVSDAIFAPNDTTVAYSSSWDHSVKTWDLTTSALVDTRTTSHPLLSLASLASVNLLATGTSARHITCMDPRASATSVVAMTLRGHNNAVVSLAQDPNNEYGLVSGSHDGTCRIWDLRSVKAGGAEFGQGMVGESVYVITRDSARADFKPVGGKDVKVFGVVWDKELGIVSGGEDKKVQLNRDRS